MTEAEFQIVKSVGFVDSDLDIEVTIEERDDPEDVARFVGLWDRLEASAKRTRARLTTR